MIVRVQHIIFRDICCFVVQNVSISWTV